MLRNASLSVMLFRQEIRDANPSDVDSDAFGCNQGSGELPQRGREKIGPPCGKPEKTVPFLALLYLADEAPWPTIAMERGHGRWRVDTFSDCICGVARQSATGRIRDTKPDDKNGPTYFGWGGQPRLMMASDVVALIQSVLPPTMNSRSDRAMMRVWNR